MLIFNEYTLCLIYVMVWHICILDVFLYIKLSPTVYIHILIFKFHCVNSIVYSAKQYKNSVLGDHMSELLDTVLVFIDLNNLGT
jgi:hypothetical protein